MTPPTRSHQGPHGEKKISTRSAGLKGDGSRGATWVGRAAAVTVTALLAGGCGVAIAGSTHEQRPVSATDYDNGAVLEVPVRLADGRTVTCLINESGYRGGLSCNWQEAR